MSKMNMDNLSEFSMLELFRMEVETQSTVLTGGLLGLEREADAPARLVELMRVAHSLKGAARIVGRQAAVRIAHAMEDCFVATQKKERTPSHELIDTLLTGVDLLNRIAQVPDEALKNWEADREAEIDNFVASLSSLAGVLSQMAPAASKAIAAEPSPQVPAWRDNGAKPSAVSDRALRVTAQNLDRLMGLAGEGLVASRWLDGFAGELLRLKRLQRQLGQTLETLRELIPASLNERAASRLTELRDCAVSCQESLAQRLSEFDLFDRRFAGFSSRLYDEVLDCRMRPFVDGIPGFQRMVRDVARSLGKSVALEIKGESTPVDRDILERLKAPLDHLLRNSLDHGIETAAERVELGKPEEALLQLEASHSAGMLLISVADDGRGVDPERLRKSIVARGLSTQETSEKLTNAELLEFLFLPGFTLKESVSELSGRGVGLDIVQTMAKEVGGHVRISSRVGQGTKFQMELPLTLSVIRTLLVEIAGEPYAFPLARIDKALKLPKEKIESLQGRQHFASGEEQIGLVAANQVLGLEGSPSLPGEMCIVVLGDKAGHYGIAVDRFLGERELVVRTLDPRLGKVKNISSAALMPDGSPVLIIDIDDLKRSIEILAAGRHLSRIGSQDKTVERRKRVLVVDDSLTVRELERKLLDSRGYAVDVAVDGMDGWNSARTGHYDLIVTDVDMPRMDGIELVKLIRKDVRLKSTPVVIVSYKDRQEDHARGLEAGADYYLTKASFHDEALARVVGDLIGSANS